jgi:hemolysin III
MGNSNSRPAEGIWNYDRVELIADGIVHAIGVSLGLAGAIAIVIIAANSVHTADMSSIVIYSIGLLSMLGPRPDGPSRAGSPPPRTRSTR